MMRVWRLSVCLYVCLSVIHTYVCHTYVRTYVRMTDRQTDRHTDRHTDRQTYVRTYVRTYVHTYIHTYIARDIRCVKTEYSWQEGLWMLRKEKYSIHIGISMPRKCMTFTTWISCMYHQYKCCALCAAVEMPSALRVAAAGVDTAFRKGCEC